jgi:hypothetical protein
MHWSVDRGVCDGGGTGTRSVLLAVLPMLSFVLLFESYRTPATRSRSTMNCKRSCESRTPEFASFAPVSAPFPPSRRVPRDGDGIQNQSRRQEHYFLRASSDLLTF